MELNLLFVCRCSRAVLTMAVAVMLAGCSGSGPAESTAAADREGKGVASPPAQRQPTAAGAMSSGATVGGDGSDINLMTLSADDIDAAALAGELACSFSMVGEAPLLLAKGDVASDAPSRGVVKVGSYVEPVAAPGGFDAMLEGTRFSGAGKTVGIEMTGPATGGGESPARPASLTYDRADGARRSYAGRWQCGP